MVPDTTIHTSINASMIAIENPTDKDATSSDIIQTAKTALATIKSLAQALGTDGKLKPQMGRTSLDGQLAGITANEPFTTSQLETRLFHTTLDLAQRPSVSPDSDKTDLDEKVADATDELTRLQTEGADLLDLSDAGLPDILADKVAGNYDDEQKTLISGVYKRLVNQGYQTIATLKLQQASEDLDAYTAWEASREAQRALGVTEGKRQGDFSSTLTGLSFGFIAGYLSAQGGTAEKIANVVAPLAFVGFALTNCPNPIKNLAIAAVPAALTYAASSYFTETPLYQIGAAAVAGLTSGYAMLSPENKATVRSYLPSLKELTVYGVGGVYMISQQLTINNLTQEISNLTAALMEAQKTKTA